MRNSREIIEQSLSYILNKPDQNENIFYIDDVKLNQDQNDPESREKHSETIIFSSDKTEQTITLLNTNLHKRAEIVSLRINTPQVEVYGSDGLPVKNIQINLVWPNTEGGYLSEENGGQDRLKSNDDLSFALDFHDSKYEILFEANLGPLSTNVFTIRKKNNVSSSTTLSIVTFYYRNLNTQTVRDVQNKIENRLEKTVQNPIGFKVRTSADNDENMIKIETGTDLDAYFSAETGFLQKFASLKPTTESKTILSKIKLIKYGTTRAQEKSGAYLFLPDGPAVDVEPSLLNWIRVEEGALRNRVCVHMTLVMHCIELLPTINKAKNFKIPVFSAWNVVDLRKSHNYELAMHVETSVDNKDVLYTDLNGFQYTKRKRYDKLTLQGNVYPMPAGAFIQDSNMRFNLLTAQPLGVASLEPSRIQVFLDRRLDQDDNRGMEQAMNDNVIVSNRFVLFFEVLNSVTASNDKITDSAASLFPSLMSSWLSNDLLYPVVKLLLYKSSVTVQARKFSSKKFPCDLHLVNMRTMQNENEEPLKNEVGLILHRNVYEDCPSAPFVQLSSYLVGECDNDEYSKFKFQDFFEFLDTKVLDQNKQDKLIYETMNVRQTILTLANLDNESRLTKQLKRSDYVLNSIQPMQIEAFRIKFDL